MSKKYIPKNSERKRKSEECERHTKICVFVFFSHLTRQTIDKSFKNNFHPKTKRRKWNLKNSQPNRKIGNSFGSADQPCLNCDISCIIVVLTSNLNVLQSFYNINKDQSCDHTAHKSCIYFHRHSKIRPLSFRFHHNYYSNVCFISFWC